MLVRHPCVDPIRDAIRGCGVDCENVHVIGLIHGDALAGLAADAKVRVVSVRMPCIYMRFFW